MTVSDILDQVAAGDISTDEAADLLSSIGKDPEDLAGEVFEAAALCC